MKYKVGQTFQKQFPMSEEKVNKFADVTGDRNPAHIDKEYAKSTIFKKRICHGMLVSSCISNVIANDLPGPGTIYLSQTLSFIHPVFLDDTITVGLEIVKIRQDKNIMTIKTTCENQDNKLVIDGEAVVKFN